MHNDTIGLPISEVYNVYNKVSTVVDYTCRTTQTLELMSYILSMYFCCGPQKAHARIAGTAEDVVPTPNVYRCPTSLIDH